MKRVIMIYWTFFLFISAQSQTILGIPFGSSYSTVKDGLKERFGEINVIEDGGQLTIIKPVIGGHEFSGAELFFQRRGQSSWLNRVFIQKIYPLSDVKYAKQFRDLLAEELKGKYYVEDFIDNDGFKCYGFGTNPKNDDEYLGVLSVGKNKGKDGKTRIYLILDYGPIYYINKASDF